MDAQNGLTIGNRYQLLDTVGAGGMGVVYRAFDRLNRQIVALKRVAAPSEPTPAVPAVGFHSTSDTRVALAHEFQTLASLHHPHIITVLDYGFDANRQPYFTMNLLDHTMTIILAGQGKPLVFKINLLIQMLQALAYLHRRGVVHRDLKPDNALVTPANEVKVLDFGLAMLREQRSAEEEIAGTLAYMAPEVLQGGEITEAADLYAVGIMAYEMIAGRHPFRTNDVVQLIQDVMMTQVDVDALDLNSKLTVTLERLLHKSPERRYHDAYEVIAALSEAMGQPVPEETSAIRESFLQAAQFVGRELEFGLLTRALSEALEGKGSAWLVGGESGVGKSRLLDELRIRALVRGALVLHGQGVAEGGLSYQLWRGPVRRLALLEGLSDLDASTLKQIIPDIGEMLGRDIPDAPELEGQAGQQRLLQAVLEVFRRQEQPVVLILEDLQWAVESLDVLRPLLTMMQDLPLLIVGDYRSDEDPDLPDQLLAMQHIKLGRLGDEGIEQLSVSMLGESGQRREVLDFLKHETEGNVFFLVEVVRALAEEAGGLTAVGRDTLPRAVVAGGVQQVVQRRLDRVPDNYRPLLRPAAVLGRQLDLGVLRALDSQVDLDDWLTQCANAAVLDLKDEKWRFAHEKLRESLLRTLSDDERRLLNVQVAAALEQVYANDLDEYAALIADHYEQAGKLAEAAPWYVRAGKHAQASYVPVSAINYYRKALEFGEHSVDPQAVKLARQVEAYSGLGEMLNWQAQYADAADVFTTMRAAAEAVGDSQALARAWRGMAVTQMYEGDFRAALASLARVEELTKTEETHLELATALGLKGWCLYVLGDPEAALATGQRALTLNQERDNRSGTIACLNLLGSVRLALGQYEQAGQDYEHALVVAQELGDRALSMNLVNNLGVVAAGRGDYRAAMARYQEALAIARQIGTKDAEMSCLSNLGGMRASLGDYGAAEADLRQVIHMAEAYAFGQISETYRFLAEAYLGQAKLDAALDAAVRALALGREIGSQEFIAAAWRVLGQVAARRLQPVTIRDDNGEQPKSYTPAECFAESLRICQETGMEGERARTLKAWATYEREQGDSAKGAVLWQEAREVFLKLGAELEVQRMGPEPLNKPE